MATLCADAVTHPFTLAHNIEATLPNLLKIIGIDVALCEPAVDVRASRDRAVGKDRCDVYSGATEEVPIPYGALVPAHPRLTTKTGVKAFFAS
jgi:hypothetical protein